MFNKKGLVYGLSLIFVVIPLFKALLNLYPEFLWFDQFGFSSIWLFVFFAKWKVFIAAFVVASIWLWSQAGLTALFLKKTPPLSAVDIKTPFAALNLFIKQQKKVPITKNPGIQGFQLRNQTQRIKICLLKPFPTKSERCQQN